MSTLLCSFSSHFIKQLVCTPFTSIPKTPILNPVSTFILTNFIRHHPSRKFNNFLNLKTVTASFSTTSSASEPSKTGSYLSVDIQCHQDVADMFSEALLCFGAVSTSTAEQDRCNSNNEISIGSIFNVSHDVHQSIALAADSIGLKETPVYKVTTGYQSDWIENARESFNPVEVMEGLWIVPEWITPPV